MRPTEEDFRQLKNLYDLVEKKAKDWVRPKRGTPEDSITWMPYLIVRYIPPNSLEALTGKIQDGGEWMIQGQWQAGMQEAEVLSKAKTLGEACKKAIK